MELFRFGEILGQRPRTETLAQVIAVICEPEVGCRARDACRSMTLGQARGYLRAIARQAVDNELKQASTARHLTPSKRQAVADRAVELTIDRVVAVLEAPRSPRSAAA